MSRTRAIAAPVPITPRLDRLQAGRLARRAARGDRRAFETIFRRYHQELYRYCLGIVRNPADAEDALQATMAAALRALPGEDRDVELRPWLYRVAHNESITLIRGRRESELSENGAELVERSAAVRAEERERLRELVEDLRQLPERQRSAILMRELNDVSYSDIAGALDCSEGAARQTVYEARSALFLIAEGRSMECEDARVAISSRDGRRLRGRRVRTHLRTCEGCRDFQAVIAQRQADMRMLFPALPAAAAATLFGGMAGGGASVAGTAAVGGGAAVGAAVGTSAVVKGASVLAAAAVAVGAADLSGAIDLGGAFRGSDDARDGGSGSAPAGSQKGSEDPRANGAGGSGANGAAANGSEVSARGGAAGAAGTDMGRTDGGRGSATGGDRGSAAPGRDASPGRSGETPGRSEEAAGGGAAGGAAAPGQVGGAGKSESAPGNAGGAGNSESAPGQVGGAGKSESAPGHTGDAGNSASAPGQVGGAGNSASAPGHAGGVPSAENEVPSPGVPSIPSTGVKPEKVKAEKK